MDIKRDFAEYLYNRLPKIYRNTDRDFILQRFIETFVEGGFNIVINDMVNLPDLLDVDKCPKKFLPLLSKMYGYEYSEELPELFQRRLLKNIVEMYKRKGTKSVVKFIARELSGFETELIENKDFTDNEIELTGWDIQFKHYRNFVLKLKAPFETSMLNAKEDAVRLIIKDFLPTNSNVFIITSYWFEEQDSFENRIVEDMMKEVIHEYNEEALKVTQFIEKELSTYFNLQEDTEEYKLIDTMFVNMDSHLPFLNDLRARLNETFILNNVSDSTHIRDKFHEKHTLKASHKEKDKMVDLTINNFNINSVSETNKYVILLAEGENHYTDLDYVEPVGQLSVKDEERHKLKASYNDTNKMVDNLDALDYTGTSVENESLFKVQEDILVDEHSIEPQDNSVLNRPSCILGAFMTNGVVSYDVIKEKGQEDKIFIL